MLESNQNEAPFNGGFLLERTLCSTLRTLIFIWFVFLILGDPAFPTLWDPKRVMPNVTGGGGMKEPFYRGLWRMFLMCKRGMDCVSCVSGALVRGPVGWRDALCPRAGEMDR